MKILGIDPGTGRVGWGIIQKTKQQEKLIDYGCFETKPNSPLPQRLALIYHFLDQLIKKHQPQQAAIELLYFARNTTTAMAVSAARGVILLVCQQHQLKIAQYTPLQIKSSLTGYGQADKKQIQYMVKQILKLKTSPKSDDAADALAVALTHLFKGQVLQ